MTLFSLLFRALKKIRFKIQRLFEKLYAYIILKGNDVSFNTSLICNGIPRVSVHRTAHFTIGNRCTINSGISYNPIGRYTPSFFMVRENASLKIGNNVGMSSVAFICHNNIEIRDNVKIGGGVCIYDTDFHSLKTALRIDAKTDKSNTVTLPVNIKKNAFIGAHSTILKGVTIGENSIVGASSLVTKNIPDNEIWGGNPAKFIKKV